MPATSGSITRCDIRVPNQLYDRIEALAIERGAKIHHRSGKPEVTNTLLELIKVGLRHSGEIPDIPDEIPDRYLEEVVCRVRDKLSENLSDISDMANIPDSALDKIADKVYERLSEKLSGKISEDDLEEITARVEDRLSGNSSGLSDENLEQVVAQVHKNLSDALSERLSDIERQLNRDINKNPIIAHLTEPALNSDSEDQGISAKTLAPIFDDEVEPHLYDKPVNPDLPPFPADGLRNCALATRYGMNEATSRKWHKMGKHLILIARAGETIRWDGSEKKWFLMAVD